MINSGGDQGNEVLEYMCLLFESVFKYFHPGGRSQKVADSHARFAGYVSAKRKLRIQKYPET